MMYTTYHLSSAQDVNSDILDAIKATFKSKPITIIVEEDENSFELNSEMMSVLDERLQEDETTYLTSEQSINHLKAAQNTLNAKPQKSAARFKGLFSTEEANNYISYINKTRTEWDRDI